MSEKYSLRNLKVAGILDELSCFCFPYECQYKNLTYDNWNQELDEFQPQLLFVESAWHGVNNKWYRRVYNCDPAFIGMLNWCKKRGIPTVFWNKEDPVHFDTFLGAASYFDWVFTTDMDCVPLYKRMLHHNNVGVLPFAVETKMFTPIEKYERKPGCCFAGSYYAKQTERCNDFIQIVDLFKSKMPFAIYDRNVYPGDPDYTFPEKYQHMIVGSLPMNKIDIAYKGYDWSLTMNIVKRSSTMEARRIFELLACNTLSVSNPCSGIKTLLGDIVLQDLDNTEEFERRATDKMYGDRIRLLGLRKVLSQHTYYHRMVSICNTVFNNDFAEPAKKVCCFSIVKSQKEINSVIASFNRIIYTDKTLTLFIPEKLKINETDIDKSIRIIKNKNIHTVNEIEDADYYCYLSSKNYYGSQYISDLLLSLQYSTASVFGKCAYYKWSNGSYTAVDKNKSYTITDSVIADRCIFTKSVATVLPLTTFAQNKQIEGFVTMSTDMFHFCEGFKGNNCKDVEDVDIDCGVDMDYLWKYALNLPSDIHYEMPHRKSGIELSAEFSKNAAIYKTMELANDAVGLYSLITDYKNLYVTLTDTYNINDYNIDGWIRIYLGGYGYNTKFIIQLKDSDKKVIKSTVIQPGQYLRCPITDNMEYFTIYAVITTRSVFVINELIINTFPNEYLTISENNSEAENNE